jgi:hypothetical protein
MDTHINQFSNDGSDTPHLIAARLPGEMDHKPAIDAFGVDGAPVEPERAQPLASRPIKWRTRLLVGTALAAITAAGASFFLISPYNKLYPVPGMTSAVHQMAAKAGMDFPALVAPSASLAKVNVSPQPAAIRDAFTPRPKSDQVAEIRSLGSVETKGPPQGSQPVPLSSTLPVSSPEVATKRDQKTTVATAQPLAPPAGSLALEPGAPTAKALSPAPVVAGPSTTLQPPLEPVAAPPVVQPPAPHDVTSAVMAAVSTIPTQAATTPLSTVPATTPPALAAAAPSPTPLPPPPAPEIASPTPGVAYATQPTATAASATQGALLEPHTGREKPKDLTEMANMVTLLSTMVRNLEIQQTQLQAFVKGSAGDTAVRLDDFGQRLAFSEARNAIAAAQDVGGPTPADDSTRPPSRPPVVLTRAAAALPTIVAAQGGPGAKRYHVQAASPGLALLAEVERGGGEGAQIQVVVGDTIPGYGRVKDISQRGTTWSVTTENGAIQ